MFCILRIVLSNEPEIIGKTNVINKQPLVVTAVLKGDKEDTISR